MYTWFRGAYGEPVNQDRVLDVVVFGATGFTGRLVVRYLAAHAPAGIRDSPQHGKAADASQQFS